MGMFDHRQIKLPGGTVTSGADLANRGISEYQYPSVAEIEINIQDNLNRKHIFVPAISRPKKPVTYKDNLASARTSFRGRGLALICLAMIILGILNGNFSSITITGTIVVMLVASSYLIWPKWQRPKPQGQEGVDKKSTIVSFFESIFGFSWKFFCFLIAELVIAVAVYNAMPKKEAYILPKDSEIYTSAQPNYLKKSKEDARKENSNILSALFKDGTDMSKIYQGCNKKTCTMPDYSAFVKFKMHALRPATYQSDICLLLASNNNFYNIEKFKELPPEFHILPLASEDAGGISCNLSKTYASKINQRNQEQMKSSLMTAAPLFVLLSFFYCIAIYRTWRWK